MDTFFVLFGSVGLFIMFACTLCAFVMLDEIHREHEMSEELRVDRIHDNLNILGEEDADAAKKARAFTALIEDGYVLRHTLTCSGGDYDDEVQSCKFCEAINHPGYAEAIMSIEGRPF